MKKIEKVFSENGLYILILTLCFLGMLVYVSEASSNVPIMDYWRYLDTLGDKLFKGGVSFSDIYNINGVHRSVYQLVLFLINVKLFHWNTQISMYLSPIVMVINSIIFRKYIFIANTNTEKKYKDILSIIVTLMIFSLGPYEIIAQEFSLSLSLRILVFITISIITSNFLKGLSCEFSQVVFGISLFYIFEIIFIGGAYSIGLMVAIIAVIVFDILWKYRKKENVSFLSYVILLSGIFLGLMLYFYGLKMPNNSSSTAIRLGTMIISFVKGLFLVCGTSVVGSAVAAKYMYIAGAIILILHIIFVVIYCLKKFYEKTYVPAIMYIYFGMFYGMIFLGRTSDGIGYLTASRYMTDSIFAIWADLIVLFLMVEQISKVIIKRIAIFILAGMIVSTIWIDISELKVAKYRKIYCDNLIEMMFNIEEYSDEELKPFQATTPEMVRHGVRIMQEHELGVFRK